MRKFFYFISILLLIIGFTFSTQNLYSRNRNFGNANYEFANYKDANFSITNVTYINLNNNDTIVSDSTSIKLNEVIVRALRGGKNSPFAKTTINREQILKEPASHSIPMIIALEPGVVATTEGGLGLGYSKFSVRGSDPSRTNITLNGIAINDGESQEVFWVNLPSISGAMQSIQLTRGVGSSSNGPGAFGATMDLQTLNPSLKYYVKGEFSFGSYDTYMSAIGLGSGKLPVGKKGYYFSFDGRFAHNNTHGYIRNAKADLNSLFLQSSLQNSYNLLKFIYIFGDQKSGITWDGCPIEMYPIDRKYNSAGQYYNDDGEIKYYDNETDNYKQHHFQLHYVHDFRDNLKINATLHFTKGDGYYENYKYNQKFSKYNIDNQIIDGVTYKKSDFIIQQLMDNKYYAASLSFNYSPNKLTLTGGATLTYYDGDHFGRLLWSKYNASIPDNYKWYDNNGRKLDGSIFIKTEYQIGSKLSLFIDLQARDINFHLDGMDKDFVFLNKKLHYTFFNPKGGITYLISPYSKLYSSVAMAHREPSRADIKESIKAEKENELKKERLVDFEIGYILQKERFKFTANLYAMEYKDQLVATGRLTETGYVIQENIPNSYRRGVEISAQYTPVNWFLLGANITFSKNRLKNYTLYTDTYDNTTEWTPLPQTQSFIKSSHLSLSPEIIAAGALAFYPFKGGEISLSGKFVGKQYLDNSSMQIAKVPSYFTTSLNISKRFNIKEFSFTISGSIDNLLNRKYYSYGWIYRAIFASGEEDYIEKAVYSQARTHFIVRLSFDL